MQNPDAVKKLKRGCSNVGSTGRKAMLLRYPEFVKEGSEEEGEMGERGVAAPQLKAVVAHKAGPERCSMPPQKLSCIKSGNSEKGCKACRVLR